MCVILKILQKWQRRRERRHLHSLVYVQNTHKKTMNQEGVPLSKKCARPELPRKKAITSELPYAKGVAGRPVFCRENYRFRRCNFGT